MINRRCSTIASLFFFSLIAISACDSGPVQEDAISSDDRLKAQVERALASTPDIPPGLSIEINQGHARISGSLNCEDCGGMRTPGNIDTIQQSLGAIVRAVPGITEVEFFFDSENPE